jgi:hypothetical protein
MNLTNEKPIWFPWMQGLDKAPELVKICHNSILEKIPDRKVIVLTKDNINEFVEFPEYIISKYNSGEIGIVHFVDILRIALLVKYGGTWIDATVLCTETNIPSFMLDSDLFFFQCLKPGANGQSLLISSWFITAKAENRVIKLVQALLYRYWQNHNFAIDYYLIHYLFQLALETYPSEWKSVIPYSNAMPHILLLNVSEDSSDEWLQQVFSTVPFHKLSHKKDILPEKALRRILDYVR